MKKRIFLLVGLLLFGLNVEAVESNANVGNNLNEYSCSAFQDKNMHISGDTYFGRCMQASCNNGNWSLRYYSTNSVSCSNGNLNPYVKITKTGCSDYQGKSCRGNAIKYCTTISYFDCDRTSNGSKYTTQVVTKPSTSKTSKSTTKTTTTEALKNNNTYLSSLILSDGIISFNKEVREYSVTVSPDISFISVQTVTESETSTVAVSGNTDLVVGNNVITIAVTAEDGTTGTYIINVIREEKEVLSNNAKLSLLTIEGYDIDFNSDVFVYSVKTKESSLGIEATAEDPDAIYMIEGNENLKNGSVVKVIVTAADGETMQEYIINVSTPYDVTGIVTVIFVIILIIVIGGGIFYFISKKNSGGEKSYEYE